MKTVVIEGKDLLFTLFKLAFYIWIEMWNVRILLVAVKMVIAVGGYSTYLAVILVSAYGICSAYRGLKKTVGKTLGVDLGITTLLGFFVLASLLVNEIRSICENLVEMGVDVPKILIKGLEVADKAINKDGEDIDEGE